MTTLRTIAFSLVALMAFSIIAIFAGIYQILTSTRHDNTDLDDED